MSARTETQALSIQDQIAQEQPLHAQGQELALRYRKPFTIWRDGDYAYLRCGTPETDSQAIESGWQWMAIITPPNRGQA